MSAIPVPFRYSPIERVKSSDSNLAQRLAKGIPLVVTDSDITAELAKRWSVTYLEKHFDGSFPCNVFRSKDNIFQYWDDEKNTGKYKFEPPTSKSEMPFKDFVSAIRQREDGKGGGEDGERLYLQQSLVVGVGEQILEDFKTVKWERLFGLQRHLGFGALTTNLLLVGEGGNVTPLHYDEQENFFHQLHGRKHIFLFPPADWPSLYPFPVHHACDRQSMLPVARAAWEVERVAGAGGAGGAGAEFASAREAEALHACLAPGEMVYIPAYWWHHIVGVGQTVSLTFWFKSGPSPAVTFPLTPSQLVALRRNVEGLMGKLVGAAEVKAVMQGILAEDLSKKQAWAVEELKKMLRSVMAPAEVRPFLAQLARGRFNLPTHE